MRQMAPEIAAALGGGEPQRRRGTHGERMFTIATSFELRAKETKDQRVPMIRMRGRWLQKLGFRRGDRVIVEARRGELVLKLAREE